MPSALFETAAALPDIPCEGLDGLMMRLDGTNHYEEKDWLKRDFGLSRPLLCVRSESDYALLSALTELDYAEIWVRTVHRYAPYLLLPHEMAGRWRTKDDVAYPLLDDRWLTRCVIGQSGTCYRKICPHHWREERTLLLPWALRYVTACPTHKVLLIDRCCCGKKLRFDPRTGLCASCGVDVGTLEAPCIANDPASLAVTSLVWASLGHGDVAGVVAPGGKSVGGLMLPDGHTLQSVTPAALFRVIATLVNLLHKRDRHNPFFMPATGIVDARPLLHLHHGDNTSVHAVLLCMWHLIVDWPTTWEASLLHVAATEQRRRDPVNFPHALLEPLDGPDFAWLWHSLGMVIYAHLGRTPGVFRWLSFYHLAQDALDHKLPQIRTLAEVGQVLSVSHDMLERYVIAGELVVLRGQRKCAAVNGTVVDEEGVDRLARRRSSWLNFAETVAYMGIDRAALMQLVDAGILTYSCRHDASEIDWLFEVGAIDDALSELMGCIPIQPLTGHSVTSALTLSDALSSLGVAYVSLPDILRAAQRGDVYAYRIRDSVWLSDLRFDAKSVDGFRTLCATRDDQVEYTSTEACRVLRCTRPTLGLWVAGGLLTPSSSPDLLGETTDTNIRRARGSMHFDRSEIDCFRKRYMGMKEAATAFGCSSSALTSLAQTGELDDAFIRGGGKGDAFLFDRARMGVLAAQHIETAKSEFRASIVRRHNQRRGFER